MYYTFLPTHDSIDTEMQAAHGLLFAFYTPAPMPHANNLENYVPENFTLAAPHESCSIGMKVI